MPTVIVVTDTGEQVWQSPALGFTIDRLHCPGNNSGATLADGIRRAVLTAEAMEEGRDPEQVIREATARRKRSNLASYTITHMHNLSKSGKTIERFRTEPRSYDESRRAENRARSRIMNAANRLGIKVSTRAEWGEHGPQVVGTIREEQHEVT